MKQKSLKKNIGFNFVRTLSGVIFPLITFPYASRVLLPSGIGKVNFANSVVVYFSMIAALGISTYGIREGAKVREDNARLSKFTKEVFTINCVSTVIAYLLFFSALFLIPKLHQYRKLLCISSATILFTTLGKDWLFGALEEYRYITIRSVCFQFLSLILLFFLVRTEDDYIKYAGISVIANAGSNILNFFYSGRLINFKIGTKCNYRKHLKPIMIFFASSIAVSIYVVLDSVMLGFLATDKSVGIYTAANKIVKIILALITSLTTVLMPRLSYYVEKGNKKEFSILLRRAFNYMLMLSLPVVAGLVSLSAPLILLFCGENYRNSIGTMQLLSPIIFIIMISNFIGYQVFIPLRLEKKGLVPPIIGAVVNFSINWILIPRYQEYGAAIATVIAELAVTITILILARKYVPLKDIFCSIHQYVFAALIMFVCIRYEGTLFTIQLVKIAVECITGALLYAGLLLLFKNPYAHNLIHILFAKKKA